MGFLDRKEEPIEEKVIAKETVVQEPVAEPTPVEAPTTKPIEEVKEEEKVENRYVVVKELPTQVVRETTTDDGVVLHFITIEEALTQALNQ